MGNTEVISGGAGGRTPGIEFEAVSFSYDGQRNALSEVSIALEEGSFTCVLGGNGSGKSTFARHVNALLVPDAGRVRVLGRDTGDPANTLFVRSHAGMVFQNPDDQIVASVIENDVAFGPENLGVPADELRQRVDEALEQVGLQGFAKKQTEALSGGQKQRVAVAGALAMHPQILVFDEASAMLDPRGRAGLMRVCRELNASGIAIVLITHFMEEAAQADRVVVLDGGTVALNGPPEEVLSQADRLAALALDVPFATRLGTALRKRGVPVDLHVSADELQRDLESAIGATQDDAPTQAETGANAKRNPRDPASSAAGAESTTSPAGPAQERRSAGQADADADAALGPAPASPAFPESAAAPDAPDAPPAIEFRDVSFTYEAVSQKRRRKSAVAPGGDRADWGRAPDEYWAIRDLSFAVREGQMFGIAGHTGSGKSTLLQLACGLLKPNGGTVSIRGRELAGKGAAEAARQGIGVVFQYPERQLFAPTVFEDVAFGPRNLGRTAKQAEQDVHDALELVHLDFDDLRERNPFALSGGQQRRVAIAGVLAMRPRALMLDEPAAGLDPLSRQRLLSLLQELHDAGMTVVIVSHDMDDLAALCNRILVLNEGREYALGAPADVFADEERMRQVGLGVPHAAHLANRLAAAGIPLAVGALPTVDELADAIAELPAWRARTGHVHG